ncbi:CbtA family protein [Streptomyces tremellae]|uniref:CbtA family protein n=1 Tax=Streptomyces tremellae TaxID=1124239 RepID=A0ABP7EB41_9ACTN
MEKRLILRGVLAGAVAGLLAFLFARIFAEPLIGRAIDYESGRDAAQAALDKAAGLAPEAADPDIFSRTVQADVGIGVGMVFFGMAMGALFAIAYAVCLGRVGKLRARSLAMLVALGGFLGFYLVPFVKYPANPPSIGHPDTIRERGNLYLVMVGASIVLLVLAVWLGRRLAGRFGNWNATLLAALAYAVVIGVVMALLPSLGELSANVQEFGHHATETPLPLTDAEGRIVYPGFPADTLFSFRFYSVAAQLILWGALGLVFAPMAERLLAGSAAPERGPARAAGRVEPAAGA